MIKIAIVTTHPIQYYAPFFALLSTNPALDVHVFYTGGQALSGSKYDVDFGASIEWDIPLLQGYRFTFLHNKAKEPGSHHFRGIDSPSSVAAITNYSPNYILIYGWAYKTHLRIMKHFKGRIPIWFRGDSTLLDQKKGVQRLLRNLFLKWVYKGIDKALYVGEENKKYFKAMGFKDSQLAFMPHAVDNERFAEPRQQEAMALRSELGISPDEKVILFAGKLEAKKDPELLIDAFIELNAPMVHLLIVGSGTFRERIRRKAKDNVKIHLLDFRNQSYMPVLYQACDIYCLPSKGPGETWGLAVNEAMASGRAVLVSDRVGCAADLVKPGKNGYVFRSGSDISLKENIQRMLSNDLHQPGGESKRIVEQYSFREQLNTILELVKSYLI